jgi:hypothetical protein
MGDLAPYECTCLDCVNRAAGSEWTAERLARHFQPRVGKTLTVLHDWKLALEDAETALRLLRR